MMQLLNRYACAYIHLSDTVKNAERGRNSAIVKVLESFCDWPNIY